MDVYVMYTDIRKHSTSEEVPTSAAVRAYRTRAGVNETSRIDLKPKATVSRSIRARPCHPSCLAVVPRTRTKAGVKTSAAHRAARAVILDVDGTLIDSVDANAHAARFGKGKGDS